MKLVYLLSLSFFLYIRFTTVEGLLCDIQKDLEKNPFLLGDSASKETKDRIHVIINDIQKVNF